ncbi:MAG: WD40 repeat domain-containing protein, partial [Longimicrobiales bacterium]
ALLRAGNEVKTFRYEGAVELVVPSPDGSFIALASELGTTAPDSTQPGKHRVTVWDAQSGTERRRFDYDTRERGVGGPDAIVFGDDRWYLSVQDARRLENGINFEFKRWELKSGRQLDSLPSEVQTSMRSEIARSADARTRALGSGNVVVVVAGEREIARIDLPLEERRNELRLTSVRVALSPSARYLAAITGRTNVRIWPLAIDELIRIACARVTRQLTAQEWSAYLGEERQRATCPAL